MSLYYVWCKPYTYLAPTITLPPNGLKQDSRWPMSPRSSIGCVKNDFWANDTFSTNRASILHQHLHYLQIDRKKLWLEPRHLGVPSGASKMILKPMVRLVQTVHYLPPTLTPSQNGPKQDSRCPKSTRSSIRCVKNVFWAYDIFGATRAPILRQYMHYLQMDRKKLALEHCHLGVPSGASKIISEPILRLVQTVYLCCTDTKTVSKQIETRFHMTHIM
jgi:hypothetical protein